MYSLICTVNNINVLKPIIIFRLKSETKEHKFEPINYF